MESFRERYERSLGNLSFPLYKELLRESRAAHGWMGLSPLDNAVNELKLAVRETLELFPKDHKIQMLELGFRSSLNVGKLAFAVDSFEEFIGRFKELPGITAAQARIDYMIGLFDGVVKLLLQGARNPAARLGELINQQVRGRRESKVGANSNALELIRSLADDFWLQETKASEISRFLSIVNALDFELLNLEEPEVLEELMGKLREVQEEAFVEELWRDLTGGGGSGELIAVRGGWKTSSRSGGGLHLELLEGRFSRRER